MSAGSECEFQLPCNRTGETEGTFTELGVYRRGTTNFGAEHAAERSPGCGGVAGSTIVRRYSGHVPTTIPYISMTSLYCTRQRIGSQWSWIRLSVTWSRGLSSKISRAAACWTRCKTPRVDCSAPASNELQKSSLDVISASTSRIVTSVPTRRRIWRKRRRWKKDAGSGAGCHAATELAIKSLCFPEWTGLSFNATWR